MQNVQVTPGGQSPENNNKLAYKQSTVMHSQNQARKSTKHFRHFILYILDLKERASFLACAPAACDLGIVPE